MAARKISDEMIDRIATWDLQGWSLRDMAAELPISKEVVRRNLKKVRAERRRYHNVKESHFLSQDDDLKQQAWKAARTPVVEKRVEETPEGNRVTITTKAPPIAAMVVVKDILKEQSRLFGMGAEKIKLEGQIDMQAPPSVVNVGHQGPRRTKAGDVAGRVP